MADTYEKFTTTGQTVFTLPFSSNYLLKSHVKVYKGRDLLLETQTATLSEGTDYTFSSATQITLSTGLASGEELTIQRQTPEASQLSPWNDGSNLTAEALNKADLQCLYNVQEQSDLNALNAAKAEASKITANTASTNASNAVSTANAALPKAGGSMTGAIAMGTNKITGLGDPTAAQDAVTKAYLERTGSIQSAQIQDGTLVNDDVNASAAIAQSKLDIANATTSASGYMSAADKSKLDSCDTGAKDDQTAAEIKTLVGQATDSNVYTDAEKTKLAGCDVGAKDDQTASEIRALVESATDSNVFTDADHTKLNGIETAATADQTAAEIKTAYESNAQTNPLTDAEKAVIDGVTANTSELNKLDGVTASTTELNIVAGKTFRASTDGALSTTSDTEMPSSKVVANHVAAQIGTVGGFTTIANDASFPATASQPANGVIISISDAQGVAVSGTTSTTGRTVDGTPATVTINNFPSSLTGETLASGVGLLVTSTGSGNIYNYHKLLAAESDVKQLSDDINNFNARYRIASSAPGSNNDDGDLWFDTSAKKMKVYNGTTSAWDDVASVGNFFINTLSSSSGTGGGSATFNGTATRFTLSNPPTMAQQLIVSVNGVVQRPNSGTSPSEGFAISGSDIIFSAAPASGSDFFIITQGSSVSIGTPSDNTVTAGKIVDGEIGNAKISNSANIAGSKVADDSIPEAKLDVHNAPATDKYLKYTSNGMEWADGASEGTDVKSTGESGTAKFLRVDGDGTCSWQVPPDTNTQLTLHDEDNFASNSATAAASQQSIKAYVDTQVGAVSVANEITTTASGAVAAGKTMMINSNGSASQITESIATVNPPTSTSVSQVYGSSANNQTMAYDTDNNRLLVMWRVTGGNSTVYASAATIASDGTFTWGSTTTLSTSIYYTEYYLAYATSGKFVFCSRDGTTSGTPLVTHVVSVASDLSVSWGSKTNVQGTSTTVGQGGNVIYHPPSGKLIYMWQKNSNSDIMATYGTISGTTVGSWGSAYTVDSRGGGNLGYKRGPNMAYDPDTEQVVLLYSVSYSSTDRLSATAIQVDSSSLTIGPNVDITTVKPNNSRAIGYDEKNNKLVFLWHDDVSPFKCKAITATLNGTGSSGATMSFGDVAELQTAYNTNTGKNVGLSLDNKGNMAFYFQDGVGSSYTNKVKLKVGTINGDAINLGTETTPVNVNNSYIQKAVYAPNINRAVCLVYKGDSNLRDTELFTSSISTATSNSSGYIGIANTSASDGNSVTIRSYASTVNNQSGLTPGSLYYIQKDGTLATTADTPSVEAGVALSQTMIMIKG